MPISALKFHFYKLPFFPPWLREHITYPHTLGFSDPYCVKNALYTFFLNYFFFALYSFSLPPKHFLIIFSGKLTTKNGQKNCQKEKKHFFFFCIVYFLFFLSPYGIKQNHLLFFPLFITGNRKTGSGNVLLKNFFSFFFFFFFLLFCILPLLVFWKITTYLFFSKFRLKMP